MEDDAASECANWERDRKEEEFASRKSLLERNMWRGIVLCCRKKEGEIKPKLGCNRGGECTGRVAIAIAVAKRCLSCVVDEHDVSSITFVS